MQESKCYVSMDDGCKIFVRQWKPTGAPKAVLQIVHGMAEHSGRYRELAEFLCNQGIEVWADDHRGHGSTAHAISDPSRGGQLGHCADRNGFSRVVRDLIIISNRIKEEHPHLPLILLGHSWGSFLVQAYIEERGTLLAGCILSGTRGPGGPLIVLGACLASLVVFFKGKRVFSPLLYALSDGAYNTPFQPARTKFDWLSRDTERVDAYIQDPLCGFPCSAAFYRDLLWGLRAVHTPKAIQKIPTSLPILIFAGASDPVGEMGKSPTRLVDAYKQAGIQDLEFILYPEGRHEMINELNRTEVFHHLLSWINRHLETR
ncbi:MAG: alpha/beta hydrolase [Treponemataceae bacterium]|nr:alpha/beta hydrolase [Treponemataceae bacterium]